VQENRKLWRTEENAGNSRPFGIELATTQRLATFSFSLS
jgi:hypothetical protein